MSAPEAVKVSSLIKTSRGLHEKREVESSWEYCAWWPDSPKPPMRGAMLQLNLSLPPDPKARMREEGNAAKHTIIFKDFQ